MGERALARDPRTGRRRTLGWLALVLAACVGAYALAMGIIAAVGACEHLDESEVGLILAPTEEPEGRSSARLQATLEEALRLRHLGDFQWVIISGSVDREGRDETLAMRDFLLGHGVPADLIIVDHEGTGMYESAVHAVRVMREHRWDGICVVTQYYQVPRARLVLKRVGAHTISWGHARYYQWHDVYSLAREVVAYVWYSVRRIDHISSRDWPRAKPEVTPTASP